MTANDQCTSRFRDEWLRPLVQRHWNLETDRIERWRDEGRTFLSQALVDEEVAAFEDIGELLSDSYGIDYLDPSPSALDRDAFGLVPENMVREHLSLPKALRDSTIELLTPSPLDAELLNEVEWVTGRRVEAWFCLPERLQTLLSREFGEASPVEFDLLKKIETSKQVEVVGGEGRETVASGADTGPPIIRFVNSLIADAAERRASDIHIEHERSGSTIRYRIDGKLRKVMSLPRYVAAGPTVSRIKIMSDMDLAERREPQDGRANLRVGDREVGLRVSTVPTKWGENVVLRLLDKESALVPLEELGFHGRVRERFERLIEQPEGIILVTGPTGSGKTTTLYAALARRRSEEINLVTIEDPVEYELESLTQIQVEERQGVTFASGLRSLLRQDPDVIMVGEIRDAETARVACQAALTGHLVFSTLHTRDAPSAVTRLVDMGVEPFKVAEGLTAVTAQRLVRRLCPRCSRSVAAESVDARLADDLERKGLGTSVDRAVGCQLCDYEGYRGRIALVELLEIDESLRQVIADGAGAEQLRRRAREADRLHRLREDVLWHLAQGHTAYEEVRPHLDGMGSGEETNEESASPPTTSPRRRAEDARGASESAGAGMSSDTEGSATPPDEATAGRAVAVGVGEDEEVLRSILRSRGFETEAFSSTREGLGSVVANEPDFVAVGPEVEGVEPAEVVRRIRAVYRDRDLPVITLAESDVQAERGRSNGADDSFVLPLEEDRLEARLRVLLDREPDWPTPEEATVPPTPYDEEPKTTVLPAPTNAPSTWSASGQTVYPCSPTRVIVHTARLAGVRRVVNGPSWVPNLRFVLRDHPTAESYTQPGQLRSRRSVEASSLCQ